MRIIIFNPYKNLNSRGLSSYGKDYEQVFQDRGGEVQVVALPHFASKLPSFCIFFLFVWYQQVVIPFVVVRKRSVIVFDVANSYSLLGAVLCKYYSVVHDLTSLRAGGYARPSIIYLRVLYFLARFSPVRVCAINDLVARQFTFSFKKRVTNIFENIVKLKEGGRVDDSAARFFRPDKLNVFVVSGPGWHKDFDRFKSFFSAKKANINFVVCGFGVEKRELGLGGVEFTYVPWVSNDELSYLYSFCDANVFYSKHEGFGRPIIEAVFYSGHVYLNKKFQAAARVINPTQSLTYYIDFEELFVCLVEGGRGESGCCQLREYFPPLFSGLPS